MCPRCGTLWAYRVKSEVQSYDGSGIKYAVGVVMLRAETGHECASQLADDFAAGTYQSDALLSRRDRAVGRGSWGPDRLWLVRSYSFHPRARSVVRGKLS